MVVTNAVSQIALIDMERLQQSLIARQVRPGALIANDSWESTVDLYDYSTTQTAVHVRELVVVDARCNID
jgi:hypothetical protein